MRRPPGRKRHPDQPQRQPADGRVGVAGTRPEQDQDAAHGHRAPEQFLQAGVHGDGGESIGDRMGEWFERKLGLRSDDDGEYGLSELMARSLDTMQAQIARVQLALDPPELVIRIPRDACQFYEFWRAAELIDIGRAEAEKALDAAGY